jgi:protein-disulfide isomerase
MKLGTVSKLLPALVFISALSLTGAVVSAEESPSDVVAVVGGHAITRAQLEAHQSDNMARARSDLMHSRMAYYEAERSALDREIDKELLSQEAAKQHITGDQLLKREVEGRVKDPSEETLRIYYLGIPGGKDSYEAMRPKILHSIRALEEKQYADDYIKKLHDKKAITVALLPPHQDVAVGDTPSVGSTDAPVTVVEFADYQCPYCRQEEPTLKKLRDQYKDKIKYSYRDFPLPMHQYARKAAEASRCAGEQGQYWAYHDKLFSVSETDLGVPALKATARQLKLDGDKFDKCLDTGAESAAVEKDFDQGKDLGISGTPTVYVNGYVISGAASYDVLQELIQGQIQKADTGSKPQAKADSKTLLTTSSRSE